MLDKLRSRIVHLGPSLLSVPVKLTPFALKRQVLEQVLSWQFRQALDDGELEFLEGRWLSIHVRDIDLQWFTSVVNGKLVVSQNAQADVSFSADASDLLMIAARKQDPDTLFFQRRLVIEGDTELGLYVKNLMDAIELEQMPKALRMMLLQLAEDRRRLKGVQSTVKKAEIKVELLPKYAAWAEGILAAGGAQQDDVLMYVMLWRIDAGDYAGALEIGRHALRHGWVMPLGNRNVQTVLAEEMADAAQSAMLATTGFDADLLLQTLELTDGLDMPDQSRARLHKAIGAVLSESNPASALNHLNHALQLDPRCGVKKDKQQLERRLRNDSR